MGLATARPEAMAVPPVFGEHDIVYVSVPDAHYVCGHTIPVVVVVVERFSIIRMKMSWPKPNPEPVP